MRKTIFLTAVLAVLLSSCTQDELIIQKTDEKGYETVSGYRVPLGKALNHAERLLDRIEGGKTRGSRMVESVNYYTKGNMRTLHT